VKRAIAILIVLAVVGGTARDTRAVSKLEGYYEVQTWFQRIDKRWRYGLQDDGMPQHYFELKYLSYPYTDIESFVRIRSRNNYDEFQSAVPVEYKTPPFRAAEGHLKIRKQKFESYIFFRQNRAWIHDEPLLNLVDSDKLKNDNYGPQSSGVRTDFWDVDLGRVKGIGGTFVYFDDGGTFNWTDDPGNAVADGTDNFIFRLRKNSFSERLQLGASYMRKDWTNTGVSREYLSTSFNDVIEADIKFFPRSFVETGLSLGPVSLESSSWIVEYAQSRDPYNTETVDVRSKDNQYAVAAEMRDVRVKNNLILHAWYNRFGENFRSYLSRRFDEDRQFNRELYHGEAILLVPRKSITATVAYDTYEKLFEDEEGGGLRPTTNLYTELYVEFINGFKGKAAYNRWHGFDASGEVFDFTTYPNLFAELSVENRIAKVRVQGRIRDFDTFREVFAYGYDMEFNATGKLKAYFRVLNVNEETEARSTIFAHVRYDLGYGAELFMEYGEPSHSDNLVNTDWFVNEGNGDRLVNRARLFLKIYF
jgi:hypothetical protein